MKKKSIATIVMLAGMAVASAEAISDQAGQPVKVTDVWVVFKTHLDIGYTDTIAKVLQSYRVDMMDKALDVIEHAKGSPIRAGVNR